MLRNILIASTVLSIASTAAAQCATLSVNGTGAPGTTITLSIDGTAANAFAFVLVGETQGTTTVPLGPLGTLSLGLDLPFIPVPVGLTNSSGDASLALAVPTQVTTGLDLFGQGLTIGLNMNPTGPSGLLALCTTNVAGFHVGP